MFCEGGLQFCREADAAAFWCGRVHEFSDSREDGGDGVIMMLVLAFELIELIELIELTSQSCVRNQKFAQLYEGPHDVDAHGDCAWGVENIGGLNGTVLGEGPGELATASAAGL